MPYFSRRVLLIVEGTGMQVCLDVGVLLWL